ncbi:hypothetical protein [Mesobacterium pallidum]|uniref:hypothetical protein n=1 Tax=Mesobacterium pallidum TaxID=2872037 RepID=UPI001EE1E49F|nr:hypothetical protein [Mesobacterium pallidum]
MARRCILHVGLPKTGSTALQASLHRAAPDLLARHGIGYATAFENHSVIGEITGRSSDTSLAVRRRLRHRIWDDDAFRNYMQDSFAAQFDRSGAAVEVISGEGLGQGYTGPEVARLAEFLGRWFDDIQVCAYVRPPLEHFNSHAQQVLKRGMTFDAIRAEVAAFMADEIPPEDRCVVARPMEGLTPYLEAFGAVTLRDARRAALTGGDVVADFCVTFLGQPAAALGVESLSVNESVNATAARMLDAVNRQVPASIDGYPNPLRARGLLGQLRALPGPARFIMPGIDWAGLRAATRPQVDWMAEVSGGAVDFTDEPLPEAGPDTGADPDLDQIARLLNDALLEAQVVKARMRIQAASYRIEASDTPLPDAAEVIRRSAPFLSDSREKLRAARTLLQGGYSEDAEILCNEIANSAPEAAERGAALDLLHKVHKRFAIAAKS